MVWVVIKTLALLILSLAAPEARRWDEKLQKCNLKIKRNVDIWSLGCVFSEVATWVNKGWSQLAEYRNRRIQEMMKSTGKMEDCFHDGKGVLDAVRQSHGDIISSRRANDPITPGVVNNIIGDMLLYEGKERSEAVPMYSKSRRIINAAYTEIARAQSPAFAATHGVHPGSFKAKGPPLKDPPNLPPDYHRRGSDEPALVDRPHTGLKVMVPKRSPSPEGSGRVFSGSSRASRHYHAYPENHDETYEQGSPTTAHLPPLRPASGQSGYSSGRNYGRSSSYDHYNQRPEAHTIHSDINNNGIGRVTDDNDPSGDLSEVNHRNQASRGLSSHERSFRARSLSTSNADQEDPSWGNASKATSHSVDSKPREATASANLAPKEMMSNRDLVAPKNRKRATQLPEMSVGEGLVLKRQRGQFPREDLFAELQARDHVSKSYIPT